MSAVTIPADDRGLLLGDGLFETVLALDGRLVWWEAHVARLIRGCGVLDLPAPDEAELRRAAEATLEEAGMGRGRAAVRLTWTAGSGGRGLDRPAPLVPRLLAAAAPAAAPVAPARVAISEVRRNEGSPLSRLKSLSYADNTAARVYARARGAEEAVMLNNAGQIACATAANLFWERDGRLETPALCCGVLDGVARGQVLAAARALDIEVAEVAVGTEALVEARGLFLTNSLIGIRPIGDLDGRSVASTPLAAELAARLVY